MSKSENKNILRHLWQVDMTPERNLLVKLRKKVGKFTRRVATDELLALANDLKRSPNCKRSLLICFALQLSSARFLSLCNVLIQLRQNSQREASRICRFCPVHHASCICLTGKFLQTHDSLHDREVAHGPHTVWINNFAKLMSLNVPSLNEGTWKDCARTGRAPRKYPHDDVTMDIKLDDTGTMIPAMHDDPFELLPNLHLWFKTHVLKDNRKYAYAQQLAIKTDVRCVPLKPKVDNLTVTMPKIQQTLPPLWQRGVDQRKSWTSTTTAPTTSMLETSSQLTVVNVPAVTNESGTGRWLTLRTSSSGENTLIIAKRKTECKLTTRFLTCS
jgi:hypothetical protein